MKQISIFDNTQETMYDKSIELIRGMEELALYRNPKGYIVGYSGGKDSDVLVELFRRSGVKFSVIHNHTTLDAPETVYYIRKKFKEWESEGIECKMYYPEMSFWKLCLKKGMLPSRIARFCCAELKEKQIPELKHSVFSFGVRKAESAKRAANRDSIEIGNRADYSDKKKFHFDNTEEVKTIESCFTHNYITVNPIAYWSDEYLWDFIKSERLEVNPQYECGQKRIGCIGCPLSGTKRMTEDFERYPKYRYAFIRLCDRIIAKRKAENKPNKYGFQTGKAYFEWWLSGKNSEKQIEGQQKFELFGRETVDGGDCFRDEV